MGVDASGQAVTDRAGENPSYMNAGKSRVRRQTFARRCSPPTHIKARKPPRPHPTMHGPDIALSPGQLPSKGHSLRPGLAWPPVSTSLFVSPFLSREAWEAVMQDSANEPTPAGEATRPLAGRRSTLL